MVEKGGEGGVGRGWRLSLAVQRRGDAGVARRWGRCGGMRVVCVLVCVHVYARVVPHGP